MPFNRTGAVQLIVHAVRPHLHGSMGGDPLPAAEKMVEQVLLALDEEPPFNAAFEAMVEAIYNCGLEEGRREGRQ
jgi:hypothetical protein